MRVKHVAPPVLFVTPPRFPTSFTFARGFTCLTATHTVSGGSSRGFSSRSAGIRHWYWRCSCCIKSLGVGEQVPGLVGLICIRLKAWSLKKKVRGFSWVIWILLFFFSTFFHQPRFLVFDILSICIYRLTFYSWGIPGMVTSISCFVICKYNRYTSTLYYKYNSHPQERLAVFYLSPLCSVPTGHWKPGMSWNSNNFVFQPGKWRDLIVDHGK